MVKNSSKREVFLDAALRIIHSKGYKAMTMRDLAVELSCDVANLYNYTASKQAILTELINFIASRFEKGVEAIGNSTGNFPTKVRQLVSLYIRNCNDHPYHVSLLTTEWKHLAEKEQKRFLSNKKQVEKKIGDIIDQGYKEGFLTLGYREWTLQYLLASLRWIFQLYTDESDIPNPLDLENHLTALIMKGLS